MRHSYLLIPIGFSLALLAFMGCSREPNFWVEAKPGQKKILVSFPPLYAITHAVAGDNAYVLCLLSMQGPHDYDGAATDVLKLNKADLFIYNGLTLDDLFAKRMLDTHRKSDLKELNVGEILEKDYHDDLLHSDGEMHDHGDGKMHKHGDHDPHVWLGPKQAKAMTEIIAAKLSALDPANKKSYDANAKKFLDELDELQAHGEAACKDKKNKKIITMHEAFAYFGDAFGVQIAGTIQKRPGADPDAASMAKLVDLCRKENICVVAVEKQYSTAQAEALQRSLKAKGVAVEIVLLDPLETAEIPAGKLNPDPSVYLQRMRENIDTLAKALP